MANQISSLVIKKDILKKDWKLKVIPRENNNGRKVLVNDIYPKKECHAQELIWNPTPEGELTPVIETGIGGIEIATFTEKAAQDCHLHKIATEIYTVLEGKMKIIIGDNSPVQLEAGDEVILFPGISHEVLLQDEPFLTRVHSIKCYGKLDKYINKNGNWYQEYTLKEMNNKVL